MGASLMAWAELGDVALRYDYRPGEGPPIVLVHEMGGSLESWGHVLAALDPARAVLRFDMRGAGLSEKMTAPITMGQLAGDIADLLAHLKVTQPAILVGCAVGAGVVLQFAIDHPEKVGAAVAVNPAIDVSPEGAAALDGQAEILRTSGMRALEQQALEAAYPAAYRASNPARFAAFRARWLSNDPVSLGWLLRMLAKTDLGPHLGRINCPVLAVSGANDVLRPPAYVRSVAERIPHAQVVEIDAAHHAPDQAPEAVAHAIDMAIADLSAQQEKNIRKA